MLNNLGYVLIRCYWVHEARECKRITTYFNQVLTNNLLFSKTRTHLKLRNIHYLFRHNWHMTFKKSSTKLQGLWIIWNIMIDIPIRYCVSYLFRNQIHIHWILRYNQKPWKCSLMEIFMQLSCFRKFLCL